MHCSLCDLAVGRERNSICYYEDNEYIIVDCITCWVPIIVLKEHRPEFTEDEKHRVYEIMTGLFGNDGYIDFRRRAIPDHAHAHYRYTN